MNGIINGYQEFALGCYLCDWPKDKNFDEILELLVEGEMDDISVWEPFEDHDGEYVKEQIESMHDSVMSRFDLKAA